MLAELGAHSFELVTSSCRQDIMTESRHVIAALSEPDDPLASDQGRRAAHKLVALSSTIGARQLGEIARRIETGSATAPDVLALPGAVEAALRNLVEFRLGTHDQGMVA